MIRTSMILLLTALGALAGCDDRPAAPAPGGDASSSTAPVRAQTAAASDVVDADCAQDVVMNADGTVQAGEGELVEREAGAAIDGREVATLDGAYTVHIAADPERITFGRMFALDVRITGADGEPPAGGVTLGVDGAMPHHEHGLNTSPRVTRTGPGVYRAEGMMLHMPGQWELYFDVTDRGVTERAVLELMVR